MKTRITLYALCGAAMLALWLIFVILPARVTQKQLQSQLTEAQSQLGDFQNTLNQLPAFLKTRDDLKRQWLDINSKLYAKGDILRLFEQLEGRASDYSLQVNEISPPVEELLKLNEATAKSAEPQLLRLSLQLTGDYLSFGRFVADLETQPYYRSVSRCIIAESQDRPGRLRFMLDFKALLGTSPEVSS